MLSELIFYPLLICAMFDMILFESYFFDTEANQISFVLFIMSAILMLGFVYIPRIAVPVYAMYNLQKKRYFDRLIDITTTKSSIHLQNYFILHSLGQIVSQVVMMAAIGILIRAENAEDCHPDELETVKVSGSLRYTLVAGYILPFLGLISFCLTTYWWLQEFPIGISTDFISILKLPNITELLDMEKEGREKINTIIKCFKDPTLKEEFNELHDESWHYKLTFPFQSPLIVILLFLFTLLYVGFFISAFTSLANSTYNEEVEFDAFRLFLVAVVIALCIVNLFAFTVALFWAMVIGTIIAIVMLIVALIIFIFLLASCASNNNNNNK